MPIFGACYCKDCVKHVFHMVPRFVNSSTQFSLVIFQNLSTIFTLSLGLCRYKVKVHVTDGTNDFVFVLFGSDMNYLIEKQCLVLVSAAKV